MKLYHGAPRIVTKPVWGEGFIFNDFGQGFYCSLEKEVTKEWACQNKTHGFVSEFDIEIKGEVINFLDLNNGDYNILYWMAIVLENRQFRINGEDAIRARKYILDNFYVDYWKCDIVKGFRADDSYFAITNAFLNNEISIDNFYKAMRLGKNGLQVVLRTKKAYELMEFCKATFANKEIYYPKKLARDMKFRNSFMEEIAKETDIENFYINDICEAGWVDDDAFVQRYLLG
jgi:hypothetical protein